ncbi:GSCOCG00003152001-RA-CDS [Cotesia congregata]|nr:GSCOCG00003152001-RA-CDS [Cotesia congregata]
MSTGGKATYHCARGGQGRGEKDLSALSKHYSSRDLPSHTKLKYREPGQGTVEELRNRDFRQELEKIEQENQKPSSSNRRMIEPTSEVPDPKRSKLEAPVRNRDADDANLIEDDSDDSDSDDDTEALLAELNKIKQERAAQKAEKEYKQRKEEENVRMELILRGNPLNNAWNSSENRNLKARRGWSDDVVFKNCGRSEPKRDKRFINDVLRSDFHKKFMDKYVQ